MDTKRLLSILFALALTLSACAPSQAVIPVATIQPTATPRPDIISVLLANGFVLNPVQGQNSSKKYQIVTNGLIPDLEAVVYDDGLFSIIVERIGDVQNAIVRSVLLAAYGPAVANWVAPAIEGKDFSQPFEQNGTAGGYNINITIAGQVGWRTLNITIMPVSQ
jgi:hypothetical protein